ncbi:copper amine oxidase N-terminal domain-containing protein [Bacillus horti]|uniref:Copper amine oxidase-like N-terminal domain-containing protein n=1 Tax=Caldalkalibacillus horti TaxID=77523 RepID=A0ABT9W360_9BACI|nr:copper amine oxidase N-terminal domain-containing protein [Bacillus horti]MDQ0167507.1 hypothetical protein [Bacillus horti]
MNNISNYTQKMIQKITIATLLTSLVGSAAFAPPSAFSAKDDKSHSATPSAYVNNYKADGEVLIQNGLTYATLTDMSHLGNYKFSFNNEKKEITVRNENDTYVLKVGQKLASKNGETQSLSATPIIHNNKTLVPLRALGELFQARVQWNQSTKTAYILKADQVILEKLSSADLSTKRNAAVNLPRYSPLKEHELEHLEQLGDSNYSKTYYFEKGKSDSFFEKDFRDLISYYEIENNMAVLKWQANLDSQKQETHSDLFFISNPVLNEIGARPAVENWIVAEFYYVLMSDSTNYSLRDKNKIYIEPTTVILENYKIENVIVPIPDEK